MGMLRRGRLSGLIAAGTGLTDVALSEFVRSDVALGTIEVSAAVRCERYGWDRTRCVTRAFTPSCRDDGSRSDEIVQAATLVT